MEDIANNPKIKIIEVSEPTTIYSSDPEWIKFGLGPIKDGFLNAILQGDSK